MNGMDDLKPYHIVEMRRTATKEELDAMPEYVRTAYERGTPAVVRLENGTFRFLAPTRHLQTPDMRPILEGRTIWLHRDGPKKPDWGQYRVTCKEIQRRQDNS